MASHEDKAPRCCFLEGWTECSLSSSRLVTSHSAPGQSLGTQEELQFSEITLLLVDAQGKSPGEGKQKDRMKMGKVMPPSSAGERQDGGGRLSALMGCCKGHSGGSTRV